MGSEMCPKYLHYFVFKSKIPFETRKNVSYFTSKALFVLVIFKFKHLITRNLSDTFINSSETYADLINVNPLKKRISRPLTSAVRKHKRQ